jgi:hypothetical protein
MTNEPRSEVAKMFLSGERRSEADNVFRLFLVFLMMRDYKGEVIATWEVLAFGCGWDKEADRGKAKLEDALARLMSPFSEDSVGGEDEALVVHPGPNLYRLLNHERYEEEGY